MANQDNKLCMIHSLVYGASTFQHFHLTYEHKSPLNDKVPAKNAVHLRQYRSFLLMGLFGCSRSESLSCLGLGTESAESPLTPLLSSLGACPPTTRHTRFFSNITPAANAAIISRSDHDCQTISSCRSHRHVPPGRRSLLLLLCYHLHLNPSLSNPELVAKPTTTLNLRGLDSYLDSQVWQSA